MRSVSCRRSISFPGAGRRTSQSKGRKGEGERPFRRTSAPSPRGHIGGVPNPPLIIERPPQKGRLSKGQFDINTTSINALFDEWPDGQIVGSLEGASGRT